MISAMRFGQQLNLIATARPGQKSAPQLPADVIAKAAHSVYETIPGLKPTQLSPRVMVITEKSRQDLEPHYPNELQFEGVRLDTFSTATKPNQGETAVILTEDQEIKKYIMFKQNGLGDIYQQALLRNPNALPIPIPAVNP